MWFSVQCNRLILVGAFGIDIVKSVILFMLSLVCLVGASGIDIVKSVILFMFS